MGQPTSERRSDSTHALLGRYRKGERDVLDVLVRRYYSRVERIVRVRLGAALRRRTEVADVVQDVFVRVVEGLERFESRPDSASESRWIDWVARLATNEIANQARNGRAAKRGGEAASRIRSLAESALDSQVVAGSTAVPSRASHRELMVLMDEELAELSEPHREVILLRNHAGADWKTVAEQMGRPSTEACQELYRRAMRELRGGMRARL